jgi:response regulator RpfG family c-di-GMP phosphodiesterase
LRVQARTAELQGANDKLRRNHLKTIKVFSNLLELRGGGFAGHGRRVAELARNMARQMGLPDEQVLPIFVAGLLHDIALIGAADALLNKPVVNYNKEELAVYRQHPVNAEQSLLALDDLHDVVPLIRAHHEHFDGTGFPQHLAGTAIPMGARILAVADAYDDLQTGHVIEQAMTAAEARALILTGGGKQYDPAVLVAFLAVTEPERPKAALPDLILGTDALQPDMVVARDLVSARGMLMLTAGHRLTASLIQRLQEFDLRDGGHLKVHIQAQALT